MEILELRGARRRLPRTYVPVIPQAREHAALAGGKSVDLTEATISGFDATLICTDHDAIDYIALVGASKLAVDTRNVTASLAEGARKGGQSLTRRRGRLEMLLLRWRSLFTGDSAASPPARPRLNR